MTWDMGFLFESVKETDFVIAKVTAKEYFYQLLILIALSNNNF